MTSRQEIEEKTIVGGFKTAADGTEELVEITMAEMHAQGYKDPHEYLEAKGLRGVTREDIWGRIPESVDEGQWHWTSTAPDGSDNDEIGLDTRPPKDVSSRPAALKPPEGMS